MSSERDYLQMMSAPDHSVLVSPTNDYVNYPTSLKKDSEYLSMNSGSPAESGIFSPRSNGQFTFPNKGSGTSDSDDNVESVPMLNKSEQIEEASEDENYLRPIDVNKRREEFMKKREAERRAEKELIAKIKSERDSGYCNAPKGIELLEIKYVDEVDGKKEMNFNNCIVSKDFNETNKGSPESFMNPSYIYVEEAKENKNHEYL